MGHLRKMSPRSKRIRSIRGQNPLSAPPPNTLLHWPVDPLQFPLTQLFGENPQDYPLTNGHEGVDWGVPLGTPVFAVITWIKAEVSEEGAYGLHIILTHKDDLQSIYAHLSAVNNQVLEIGYQLPAIGYQLAPIGYSGSSGRSTGPHLHLTLLYKGKPFDPLPYFIAR